MDLMDDEGLKKSVIDQMMGELDDETGKSLKKAPPVKGVEISIIVSPKGDETPEEETECGIDGCEDPDHHHPQTARDAMPEGGEGDYINDLLKKLG